MKDEKERRPIYSRGFPHRPGRAAREAAYTKPMRTALALLLCAPSAFAAAPVLRLETAPLAASPFALGAGPAALSFSVPGPASLAPSLALPSALIPSPALASPLLAAPALAVAARPTAALPALTAFTALPAASAGDAFDGAFAEKRVEAAKAVQYARAEIPVVDYLRGAYGEERAREFMEGVFTADEKKFTGRELLSFVVTPESLNPDLVPDPDRVDFNRLGRTSTQIREIVGEKGMPYHPYERILQEAFREGLIYRLFNKNTSLTYYGVPPRVRADWGLDPAPVVEKKAEAPAEPVSTPFSEALAALAAEAVTIKDAELFEFTAQAVDAAIKAGKLPAGAVSKAFRARADALGYDVPSLSDAVITLSESAEGTPWERKTAALLALLD